MLYFDFKSVHSKSPCKTRQYNESYGRRIANKHFIGF